MSAAWSVLLAYLLGSIPTGFLLVKWRKAVDIRQVGSGNIGATNVARVAGVLIGVAVLLIDAGKAYLAIWLAGVISGQSSIWMSASVVAVMAGNAFPIFLEFRGGKAMATFVGAFLCLSPAPAIAIMAVFVVSAVFSRHVSVGSIMAAGTFPLGFWIILNPPLEMIAAAVLAAALVLWRHLENIQRLRAGTEPAFSLDLLKKI